MMKLFYTNTSPYARKVRIVLFEKGLDSQVEYILCNQFDDAVELKGYNPLGKIPTLVLDDGRAVYDSPVICEYLDGLNTNGELVPLGRDARLHVNTIQALADGIIDASYNIVMEGRRDVAVRSASSTVRWEASIKSAVKQAELYIQTLTDKICMAHITLGAALGYLDFRLSLLAWRTGHDDLAMWYEALSQRPSMVSTRPPD